jgi:hypothetical protein
MKKLTLTLAIVFSLSLVANAQDYKTGIGLRGGFYNGLTVKHFIGDKAALEGLLATRWGGLEITVLYEIHKPLSDVERLKWFYGIGGHVGFYDGDKTTWGDAGTTYSVVGIDLILGLEYSFSEIPLNLGIDWKPLFNFVGYNKFFGDGGALSIRYIF